MEIKNDAERSTRASIHVSGQRVPNGFQRRSMLQTNRRQYRRIASNSLDCTSASPCDVDENFRQQSGLEITEARSVSVASVLKVQQFMTPSLR
jgi:hypothetical protein